MIITQKKQTNLSSGFRVSFWFYSIGIDFVGIEPLKARYVVTKLDLNALLLSFWCIDIDLTI